MKKCKCGATPQYAVTEGRNCLYAQLVCRTCGAKGVIQAGSNLLNAQRSARITWEADELEKADVQQV